MRDEAVDLHGHLTKLLGGFVLIRRPAVAAASLAVSALVSLPLTADAAAELSACSDLLPTTVPTVIAPSASQVRFPLPAGVPDGVSFTLTVEDVVLAGAVSSGAVEFDLTGIELRPSSALKYTVGAVLEGTICGSGTQLEAFITDLNPVLALELPFKQRVAVVSAAGDAYRWTRARHEQMGLTDNRTSVATFCATAFDGASPCDWAPGEAYPLSGPATSGTGGSELLKVLSRDDLGTNEGSAAAMTMATTWCRTARITDQMAVDYGWDYRGGFSTQEPGSFQPLTIGRAAAIEDPARPNAIGLSALLMREGAGGAEAHARGDVGIVTSLEGENDGLVHPITPSINYAYRGEFSGSATVAGLFSIPGAAEASGDFTVSAATLNETTGESFGSGLTTTASMDISDHVVLPVVFDTRETAGSETVTLPTLSVHKGENMRVVARGHAAASAEAIGLAAASMESDFADASPTQDFHLAMQWVDLRLEDPRDYWTPGHQCIEWWPA